MRKICFAPNNPNKLRELQEMLGDEFTLVSLQEIGCTEDIAETADTIEGNSQLKAQYVWQKYKIDCFADDTGLEVEALNNEPGVYSARYAGEPKDDQKNMALVLEKLKGKDNRSARFKTVMTLILDGKEYAFEGIAKGSLRDQPVGTAGFGYDPIFEPENHSITFAEMEPSQKNAISHRGKAVQKLVSFLKEQTN